MNIKENATKGKITNYIALGILLLGGGFLVYKGQTTLTELGAFIGIILTSGGFIAFGKK